MRGSSHAAFPFCFFLPALCRQAERKMFAMHIHPALLHATGLRVLYSRALPLPRPIRQTDALPARRPAGRQENTNGHRIGGEQW